MTPTTGELADTTDVVTDADMAQVADLLGVLAEQDAYAVDVSAADHPHGGIQVDLELVLPHVE
jgi:hypothetical protein